MHPNNRELVQNSLGCFWNLCIGVPETAVHLFSEGVVQLAVAEMRLFPTDMGILAVRRTMCAVCLPLSNSLSLSQEHTHTHSLSLVRVVMIKSKELKTKISHSHSLTLSQELKIYSHADSQIPSLSLCLSVPDSMTP